MTSDIKKEVICVMCEIVLKDPIQFSCGCLFCLEHLGDRFVTKNKILCRKCNREFDVSRDKFLNANETATNILIKESYLSKDEKEFKRDVQLITNEWQH